MVEVITKLYEELAQSYIAQAFTTFFGAVCIVNALSKNRDYQSLKKNACTGYRQAFFYQYNQVIPFYTYMF